MVRDESGATTTKLSRRLVSPRRERDDGPAGRSTIGVVAGVSVTGRKSEMGKKKSGIFALFCFFCSFCFGHWTIMSWRSYFTDETPRIKWLDVS